MLLNMATPPSAAILASIPGVTAVEFIDDQNIRIEFVTGHPVNRQFIDMSVKHEWNLNEITLEKSSLDAIFAKLSGKTK